MESVPKTPNFLDPDVTIIPPPHPWFQYQITYEGEAEAVIRGASHTFTGPAVVHVDEDGLCHAEMHLKGVSATLLPLGFSECERLTVTTPDGTFTAMEQTRYGYVHNSANNDVTLNFRFLKSKFDANGEARPEYWAMPLLNFISDFYDENEEIARHPLRMNGSLQQDDEGMTPEKLIAKYAPDPNGRIVFSYQDRVILFEFNGDVAYIEPMIDYEKRKKILKAGERALAITSLMVGRIGSNPIDLPDLEEWLPSDYLLLLGLASGNAVGSPWIEFRSSDNQLVRRVHLRINVSSVSRPDENRHVAIDESLQNGTGQILTIAPKSEHWRSSPLRLALTHLVQVRSSSMLEDMLSHLVVPLDAICKLYGLDSQNLRDGLSAKEIDALIAVLAKAHDKINNMADSAASRGEASKAGRLKIIAERVKTNPMNKDKNFGLAVSELLAHLGLNDADILDQYLKGAGYRSGLNSWVGMLNYRRGVIIHEGYFSLKEAHNDLERIWAFVNHLHDVLIRIVFKMTGYDGTYQPTVIKLTVIQPVDWVTKTTSAKDLGY